jgi:hypothetical protein
MNLTPETKPSDLTPPPPNGGPSVVTPPPPVRSAEEIDRIADLMGGLLRGNKPKKPAPTTPDDKPAETPPAAVTPAATEPAKPKRTVKRVTPPTEREERLERTTERLAEATTRLVEAATPTKKEPATPTPPAAPTLSPKDQRELDALEHLAKLYPDEYKDLGTKYRDGLSNEAAYMAQWKKENPGSEFDADASEHNDFYATAFPSYHESDFTFAVSDLAASNRLKKETENRTRKEREQEAAKQIDAAVKKVSGDATATLLKHIDEHAESAAKLAEDDPAAAMIYDRAAAELEKVTAEVTRICSPGSSHRFDNNNPLHQQVMNAIGSYEDDILTYPEAQRVWKSEAGNLKFATLEQFLTMSEMERRKHWTLWMEPTVVANLMASDYGAAAKADLAKLRSKYPAPTRQATPPAAPAKPAAEHAPATRVQRAVPEGGGSARVTTVGKPASPSSDKYSVMDR